MKKKDREQGKLRAHHHHRALAQTCLGKGVKGSDQDDFPFAEPLLLPLPFVPLTCDSAASALRRSPSLRDLNGPPPGVLAPDMTDEARERTFMTNGLDEGTQSRQ